MSFPESYGKLPTVLFPMDKPISHITQCEISTVYEGEDTLEIVESTGYSKCSVLDQFCKRVGRLKSFKRAVKQIPDKKDRVQIWELFKSKFPGSFNTK